MSQVAKKALFESAFDDQNQEAWNRRILIVDDEKDIIEAYKNLLETKVVKNGIQSSRSTSPKVVPIKNKKLDFQIVTASSFDEAIELVKKAQIESKPFAMGFFDVRLGEERDGVELAKLVRDIDARMGVVFVTAYNDRSLDSIESIMGPDVSHHWDFLNKPFNGNEIIQKARNLTSLWNLRLEREEHAKSLAELNRLMLQSERITSVAAVARGVTHEFGNLLMQIIGKAEINRNKPEKEMRDALDRIIDASQRASEILDRFNNLSDNKSVGTQKSKHGITSIINEALDLISHMLRNESVNVHLDLDAVKNTMVPVHSTSLLQVFINLMINAVHALEGQQDKHIFLSASIEDQQLAIKIRDNGPGAPEEFIEKLTEAFFTTKGSKGTGLGLAICREIIEIDHAGEFKVGNSKLGGFEVSVYLGLEE